MGGTCSCGSAAQPRRVIPVWLVVFNSLATSIMESRRSQYKARSVDSGIICLDSKLGGRGLEPLTSTMSKWRSNQLS